MTSSARPQAASCATCGVEVPLALRACPSCGSLVHAAELTRLAGVAQEAERQGDLSAALTTWKAALDLLPPRAPQRAAIDARVTALQDRLVGGAGAKDGGARAKQPGVRETWRSKGALAALGALLIKFKTILFLVLAKAKLVLLGLTKLKTLLSMVAFFGVYWTMYGWKFAAGFVVSIYLHEMGHVVAARRFGLKASAPVFIPFIGAFILLKERVTDVRINARIGLAGPVWGLGTALAFYIAYLATGVPLIAAIAGVGAWINIFNLIPVWTLDGARGFTSLTRVDRWSVAVALGAITVVLHYKGDAHAQGLLMLLAGVTALMAAIGKPAEKSDKPMVALYLFLAGSLAAITAVSMAAAASHVGATGGAGAGF